MKHLKTNSREREIRNLGNRLVGKYYPDKNSLVIMIKGYITIIYFLPDGNIAVKNTKALE